MIKKFYFSIISFTLLFSAVLKAEDFAPVGTAVGQFLEIGLGARGVAIGQAFTTLTDDANAVFWNPAGLTSLSGGSFTMDYTNWPADIAIGGFSFAYSVGNIGTFSINAAYLMTDDMEITTIEQPTGTGQYFGISNYSVGISYARLLTNKLSFGITAKIVQEKYFEHSYMTPAFDIGTIYHTDFRGLKIGMSIMHFSPEAQFSGTYHDYSASQESDIVNKDFESFPLPITFRVGMSMDAWREGQNVLLFAADMVHSNNNLENYNLGFEYGFKNMLFIRGGYRSSLDEGGFSLGAGINYDFSEDIGLKLDYAYSDRGIFTNIHRLSAGFTF